ncbi:hypothetical protein HW555_004992 [Spodoptera exigua]|uniref:Uncharacterized protein n=1 Tax=Spodoptera exigua TaxID=7107 RepID=A0A835L4Y8_SPOEX|nr:hypothetical protein HW555_004992 [Spodoptera exigua]
MSDCIRGSSHDDRYIFNDYTVLKIQRKIGGNKVGMSASRSPCQLSSGFILSGYCLLHGLRWPLLVPTHLQITELFSARHPLEYLCRDVDTFRCVNERDFHFNRNKCINKEINNHLLVLIYCTHATLKVCKKFNVFCRKYACAEVTLVRSCGGLTRKNWRRFLVYWLLLTKSNRRWWGLVVLLWGLVLGLRVRRTARTVVRLWRVLARR